MVRFQVGRRVFLAFLKCFWFLKTSEQDGDAAACSRDDNDELAMDDGTPHNEGAGQRAAHEEELERGAFRARCEAG